MKIEERLSLVLDAKATLGEGPCWDHERQLLYWVDIIGKKVNIYNPKNNLNHSIDVGQYVGALALIKTGGVILALENGFYKLNIETEKLKLISDPESHLPENRFNDGKCDPAGRFWAGTMPIAGDEKTGSLYSLETDFSIRHHFNQISCSNGIAWSPEHKTMYYIDSPTKQVVAFDYDIDTGDIRNKRVVVQIPQGQGVPDGMTIDEEGMLWIAQWDGSKVSRWNPGNGKNIDSIFLPVSRATSCVFGGENLDELYITTARVGLDESTLSEQPHAGSLFRYKTNVRGLPSYRFGK